MDREALHAAVHGVTKSQTWLSNWTELNIIWKFLLKVDSIIFSSLFFSPPNPILGIYNLASTQGFLIPGPPPALEPWVPALLKFLTILPIATPQLTRLLLTRQLCLISQFIMSRAQMLGLYRIWAGFLRLYTSVKRGPGLPEASESRAEITSRNTGSLEAKLKYEATHCPDASLPEQAWEEAETTETTAQTWCSSWSLPDVGEGWVCSPQWAAGSPGGLLGVPGSAAPDLLLLPGVGQ